MCVFFCKLVVYVDFDLFYLYVVFLVDEIVDGDCGWFEFFDVVEVLVCCV